MTEEYPHGIPLMIAKNAGCDECLNETGELDIQDVLFACYRAIEEAICSDDGLDGDVGSRLLTMIVPHLKEGDQSILKEEKEIRNAGPLY